MSTPQKTDRWIRFPLALLAYAPESPSESLMAMLTHGMWAVGGSDSVRNMDQTTLLEWAEKHCWEFDESNEEQLQVLRGAKVLGVVKGDARGEVREEAQVAKFLARAGSAARIGVNMKMEYYWRTVYGVRGDEDRAHREGGALSWREFRFLSAILSKVGNHKFDRVGWQEIRARAAGFAGKLQMRQAPSHELRQRKPLLLTQDQIRGTRDRMEAGNWFVRVKWNTGQRGGNGGESWYSFSTAEKGSQGRAELADWIATRKTARLDLREEKRVEDAIFVGAALEKLRAARAARKANLMNAQAPGVHAGPEMEDHSAMKREALEAGGEALGKGIARAMREFRSGMKTGHLP